MWTMHTRPLIVLVLLTYPEITNVYSRIACSITDEALNI